MAAWKLVAVVCACAALSHVAIGYIPVVIPDPEAYKEAFDAWRDKYNKNYDSDDEYQNRLEIFMNNAIFIENFSKEKHTYECPDPTSSLAVRDSGEGPKDEAHLFAQLLELNYFADMEFEEFKEIYLMAPQNCSATRSGTGHLGSRQTVPNAIDWRQKGVVTPVKNQGMCGSCWTFSTTGCLESHHALKTGQLISLSEQQLVDCAQAFNNHGCDGGLPSQAYEYIHYNGGLETEEDYPYVATDEKCRFNPADVAATVSAVVNITEGDEDGIYQAVGSVGPVSICFDVTMGFQLYKKGVYSSVLCHKDSQHVNHAVLAVGYNATESGEPYWIVKNSWGSDWGIDGYFWIERGKNMCGLADCPSYPIV